MVKKVVLLVFLVFIAVVGGFITLHNAHQSTLELYFAQITMPFVAFLLMFLFIGGFLGAAMTYAVVFKQRLQIRRLERNKIRLQKQIDELESRQPQLVPKELEEHKHL